MLRFKILIQDVSIKYHVFGQGEKLIRNKKIKISLKKAFIAILLLFGFFYIPGVDKNNTFLRAVLLKVCSNSYRKL